MKGYISIVAFTSTEAWRLLLGSFAYNCNRIWLDVKAKVSSGSRMAGEAGTSGSRLAG